MAVVAGALSVVSYVLVTTVYDCADRKCGSQTGKMAGSELGWSIVKTSS